MTQRTLAVAYLGDEAQPRARGVRVLRPAAEAATAALAVAAAVRPGAHQARVGLLLLLVLRQIQCRQRRVQVLVRPRAEGLRTERSHCQDPEVIAETDIVTTSATGDKPTGPGKKSTVCFPEVFAKTRGRAESLIMREHCSSPDRDACLRAFGSHALPAVAAARAADRVDVAHAAGVYMEAARTLGPQRSLRNKCGSLARMTVCRQAKMCSSSAPGVRSREFGNGEATYHMAGQSWTKVLGWQR